MKTTGKLPDPLSQGQGDRQLGTGGLSRSAHSCISLWAIPAQPPLAADLEQEAFKVF